jgi:hypothetical protein
LNGPFNRLAIHRDAGASDCRWLRLVCDRAWVD